MPKTIMSAPAGASHGKGCSELNQRGSHARRSGNVLSASAVMQACPLPQTLLPSSTPPLGQGRPELL
jgi:hypothetical protein